LYQLEEGIKEESRNR